MKPSLLFFFPLVIISNILFAQQSSQSSLLFNHPLTMSQFNHRLSNDEINKIYNSSNIHHQSLATARTTTYTDWYDMWSQNTTLSGGANAVYPDSNLIDDMTGMPYHIWIHGMGMSFDPTDSSYWSTSDDPYLIHPITHPIYTGTSYTIDSFYSTIKYIRNNPDPSVVDSLIIEFAVSQTTVATLTHDSGAYNLQYPTDRRFADITYDSTPRFSTVHYNSGCGMRPYPYNSEPYINDCYFDSVFVQKQRYAFPLTHSSIADTTPFGALDLHKLQYGSFGSSHNLSITPVTLNSSNQRLISFASFKSGISYPNGTLCSNANWLMMFCGTPSFTDHWRQSAHSISYPGSYQQTLIAANEIRYSDTGWTYPYYHHDVLIPVFSYEPPITDHLDVLASSFHVSWTPTLSEPRLYNPVREIRAYPNPANGMLSIAVTLTESSNISISLVNMFGEIVATQSTDNTISENAVFNTSTLSPGLYLYTVIANGTSSYGHVTIMH